jgi:hypothetical protein
MTGAAERVQTMLALCFPMGAALHFWWVGKHGLAYHGHAPAWAVGFWYGLCALDFVVCALMLRRPRAGLISGCAVMAVSLLVNWTCFPTFQFGFNLVLTGLSVFGAALALAAPWLLRSFHVETAGEVDWGTGAPVPDFAGGARSDAPSRMD